jgi:hypothetical protein
VLRGRVKPVLDKSISPVMSCDAGMCPGDTLEMAEITVEGCREYGKARFVVRDFSHIMAMYHQILFESLFCYESPFFKSSYMYDVSDVFSPVC